jgi:TATA-box binding protein (TBP) (component of TFIID and TFIIIB)
LKPDAFVAVTLKFNAVFKQIVVFAAGCVVITGAGVTAPNTTFEVAFVHPAALYATAE